MLWAYYFYLYVSVCVSALGRTNIHFIESRTLSPPDIIPPLTNSLISSNRGQ